MGYPSHYKKYPRFFVAVDSVVLGFDRGELYVLIARRSYSPEKGSWALIGEFVRGGENVSDAAHRILKEITGISDLFMRQVGAFGDADRDSGARVVTVAYYALINRKDYDESLSGKYSARWVRISEPPPLVFDHGKILAAAVRKMRCDAAASASAFNLLPKEFTLANLKKLFEAIFGRTLDKRNFRKKIAELPYIRALDKKDYTASKRGAMLYTFDKKLYEKYGKAKFP